MGTATPFFMNYAINSVAKKSSALTEANEQSWRGIPGYYDIGLYWKHYMYNVTNFDDVRMLLVTYIRLCSETQNRSSWSLDPTSIRNTTPTTI